MELAHTLVMVRVTNRPGFSPRRRRFCFQTPAQSICRQWRISGGCSETSKKDASQTPSFSVSREEKKYALLVSKLALERDIAITTTSFICAERHMGQPPAERV